MSPSLELRRKFLIHVLPQSMSLIYGIVMLRTALSVDGIEVHILDLSTALTYEIAMLRRTLSSVPIWNVTVFSCHSEV